MKGEVPCGERLGSRLGRGREGKKEEGTGEGNGAQKPHLFLPSCLPGLFGTPQPLTTGVGEKPPALVCRVWAPAAGLGSGVGRTGDTQGQTYPLIQIEALWGRDREEEEQMINDP